MISATHGAYAPGTLDRAVLALTGSLPDTWPALRLAILLRRIVTMRLPRGGDVAFDVERWGLKLRLHPLDNGCEKNLLFTPRMYEPTELGALATAIAAVRARGRPFVFVDVGANVGLFSLFVASQARDARILAIEPEPVNLERLRFNFAANPGLAVDIAPVAIAEAPGELAVDVNHADRGGTRTHPIGPGAHFVRVAARPLLDVLREYGIAAIDALKIDIEGAEDSALVPFFATAPASLWPQLLLIEDSQHEWETDLFGLLAQKGYAAVARSRQNVVLRRA